MRKITRTEYYADNCLMPFSTEEEAINYEKKMEEFFNGAKRNNVDSIFNKLVSDLSNAKTVTPDTIATCPFYSLAIKGMVEACQQFAEKYKEFLKYY